MTPECEGGPRRARTRAIASLSVSEAPSSRRERISIVWTSRLASTASGRSARSTIAPIKVATGEMCQNRIMFKQFLQADFQGNTHGHITIH